MTLHLATFVKMTNSSGLKSNQNDSFRN